MRCKDISGQRFGVLTVEGYVKTITRPCGASRIQYEPVFQCRCDCGAEVLKVKRYLTNSFSMSCEKKACKAIVREMKKWEKQVERNKKQRSGLVSASSEASGAVSV